MAVTRINNNQITDASAGNVYVGINAGTKLQDYSITAGKIANSLTYGSDLTITGNLTVNGQTTTIDTVSTVIEDPVIVLASNQTGTPAVDIGFIGERGDQNNIAFVWDESADEFVTAFTTDLVTNTVITISSYANFHTNDANVGGNLTLGGNIALTGNVTGNLNVTGNIAGGNLLTTGVVTATGNVTGGNLLTPGLISATGNITTAGNVQLENIVNATANTVIGMGNGSGIIAVSSSGNTTQFKPGGQIELGGASQIIGGTFGGSGITLGASQTDIFQNRGGNVTVQVGTGGTTVSTWTFANNGNLIAPGNIDATGNIAGGNVITGGLISATGNITGGNLSTAGLTSTGTLTTTGNAVVGGNLIVQGNITYINIDDLRVEDPIIILGTGPNGAPLTANDSKDRGIFMEYYTTGLGNAFMGWDNSTGNMIIANDAYFTANDVVGINSYGTLEAGNLYIQTATVTGNVDAGNINISGTQTVTGNLDAGNVNVTGNVNSVDGYFTGNVGVLGTLTATSNIIANTSGIFYGDSVTGNAAIYAGLPTFTILGSNVVAQFTGNVNSYSQINFENISSGNAASTDYIATANNGDDSTFYINMGITSNTHVGIHDDFYSDIGTQNTGYLITVAGDSAGPGSEGVGNLMIGSTNGNVLTSVGNTSYSNVRTVASIEGFDIVNGNLYVTSINSRSGRITVNASDADVDFAVDGDTRANVLYVDAGTGTASFGSSTQTTGALVAFNDPTSILMPVGNTAQRPSGTLGMLRFNSTDDNLEIYSTAGWEAVGVPVFTVIADEQFNGDGSTVAFVLGSEQTTASCIVSINGVIQVPTVAYSVSGTGTSTLTFTEAPEPGDLIDVRQITTTTTVTSISNTSGNAVIATSPTLAQIDVTGNIVPVSNVAFNLGSPTNFWNELYLSGNSIYLGDIILKSNAGNLKVRNFDDTADAAVEATFISTSTTSGNLQIGLNHIEATNANGNIELRPNGTGVTWLATGNGLAFGSAANGQMYMNNANIIIDNNTASGNITFRANVNGGGVTHVLKVLGTGGIGFTGDLVSLHANGVIANGTSNIGTSTSTFNTIFAKATSAQYADLAEKYTADAEYVPGTVVEFGGTQEVTVCNADASSRVAGVISTNPSYRMNDGLESEYTAMVALTGRVPTQVVGPVRKGDMMVSAGNGRARAEATPAVGTVIGKSLVDFDGTEGVIEVVVGRV